MGIELDTLVGPPDCGLKRERKGAVEDNLNAILRDASLPIGTATSRAGCNKKVIAAC